MQIRWRIYDRINNYFQVTKIKQELMELGIDLVHTNTSVTNIGGMISKAIGVPHIWHLREFGKEDHGIYTLSSENKAYKYMTDNADIFVAISHAIQEKYKNILNREIRLVYNGVGMNNYYSNRNYDKTSKFVNFVITGRIQEGKGQLVAVKATELLIKRNVTNFRLYIAGKGDTSNFNEYDSIKQGYVVFAGQVDNMAEFRKTMDIELVCSRSEAFGRVTVEAMMSGMPVIGSDSGGTKEIIHDGVNGYLFETGNYVELASIMEMLITNPELICTLGHTAQSYAVSKFSIKRCAEQIDDIYNALIIR